MNAESAQPSPHKGGLRSTLVLLLSSFIPNSLDKTDVELNAQEDERPHVYYTAF